MLKLDNRRIYKGYDCFLTFFSIDSRAPNSRKHKAISWTMLPRKRHRLLGSMAIYIWTKWVQSTGPRIGMYFFYVCMLPLRYWFLRSCSSGDAADSLVCGTESSLVDSYVHQRCARLKICSWWRNGCRQEENIFIYCGLTVRTWEHLWEHLIAPSWIAKDESSRKDFSLIIRFISHQWKI
jgi:hypothetical protein